MKNYAGYTKVYVGFQGAGRAVYVKNDMVEIVQKAVKEHQGNYHLTTIFRQVVGLNADPLKGQGLNPASDARIITAGNVSLKYYLFNGVVLIQLLAIGRHVSTKKVALYKVEYASDENDWLPSRDPVEAFDRKNQWKSKEGTAHYMAVSGRFGDHREASTQLITHLTGAYQKEDYLTTSDAKAPYSMLWIEKGQHKQPEAAQQLASLVQQSTRNQLAVNWLIHGEGAHTFKNMASILKTAAAASTVSKAGAVPSQNVYFSNPSIDSETKLKQWCAEAGMHYVGLNTNHRNLRQWSTLKNVGLEVGKAVSTGFAFSGSVSAIDAVRPLGGGGIDVIVEGGVSALLSGDHFAALACTVASGFIVAGMVSKSKVIVAGARCTFGKGNQRWYVSDEDLLRA